MDLVETLTNAEKKLILVLKDSGNITSDIAGKEAGLNEGELNKAVEWLKEKKLIQTEDINKELFKSTELGMKYAGGGLPEKHFLAAIEAKPLSIPEIKRVTKLDHNEFNVSIGLLKKNEFIEISADKISITDAGREELRSSAEEKLLKRLSKKMYIDEITEKEQRSCIPLLESRRLVVREIEKIKRISLTDAGKKILPHIKIEDTINVLTQDMIINKTWKNKPFRKYSLDVPSPPIHIGKKQPYSHFVDELKQKLVGMGFKEMSGPVVEFSFFNNEALFMPQDHPAREIHDAFSLKHPKYGDLSKYEDKLNKVAQSHENGGETGSKGWQYTFDKKKAAELLLRSQTTAVSARMLCSKDLEIPGKYFAVSRCFRVDEIDWKHLAEFDQFEGIVIDPKLTFKELLGMLKMAAEEVGGCKKFKFAPGYFPFTEPSVELHVYMEGKGWVEIGGAGILRPELTEPLGIKEPVLAWGLGILRLFMTKYKVDDMRQIFSQDLKWLREFKW